MANQGDRVGEYLLDTRIGGGGFGEVWRAHHHVWTDQLVAIKIPTDPQYLRDLQREGVTIHGLVHPNIVKAIGFDPYAPIPYLAMEYIPGTSLRPIITNRSATIPNAIAIMRQVLSGLAYAHKQNVIHRDVKPENILVSERCATEGYAVEGLVKVTDFGLGKVANNALGSIAYSASLNSPKARDIAGTLDYMSPEQRTGAEPDARVDLYACGVVFYELLTGERPAGTELPSDLNRAVPPALDEIFRRSYARLDKRFVSADEFLSALKTAETQTSRASVPTIPTIPRINAAPMRSCSQCRASVDPTDQFCMQCGQQLVMNVRRCPKCGAYPELTDRFCIFCGETLSAQPVPA